MRISDWSSDVCSSDLLVCIALRRFGGVRDFMTRQYRGALALCSRALTDTQGLVACTMICTGRCSFPICSPMRSTSSQEIGRAPSELQSLMRISYAVFCWKKKKKKNEYNKTI